MKPLTSPQKMVVVAIAGLAAFGAGVVLRGPSSDDDALDDVVAAATRATPQAPRSSVSTTSAAPPPSSRLEPDVAFNPFGSLNPGAPAALGQPKELPPAPKPARKAVAAASAPVPAPVAPPLPFVAIGSLMGNDVTGGQPVAFLQQHEQLIVVRAGESVGNTYRVESITPQRIELTYLPLMQRQSLPLAP